MIVNSNILVGKCFCSDKLRKNTVVVLVGRAGAQLCVVTTHVYLGVNSRKETGRYYLIFIFCRYYFSALLVGSQNGRVLWFEFKNLT